MLNLDSKVCRINEILETEIDGEIALMSPEMGNYYSLNSTGSLIWRTMQSEISISDIVQKMTGTCDVDASRCESDVLHLLNEFSDLGLIVVK
jgi:hypothetical protein